MSPRARRRVWWSLAASFVIHLLLLWAYQRMADWHTRQQLRPTRYLPDLLLLAPQLFRRQNIGRLPERQMEQVSATEAKPIPLPALAQIPAQPLPGVQVETQLGEDSVLVVGAPPAVFISQPEIEPLDLNQRQIEAVLQLRDRYEGYARFWSPDVDTTDAESKLRTQARAIVISAFEAMGGLDRLLAIRELRAVVWIEASEHYIPPPGPRQPGQYLELGPYAYPIGVWRFSGIDEVERDVFRLGIDLSSGAPIPEYATRNPARTRRNYYSGFDARWLINAPTATSKLRMQSEASRWHIVDQFLGGGIRLSYVEAGRFARQPVYRITVDDHKYGRFYDAFFHRDTGLLVGTREELTRSERDWYREKYHRDPPVWFTTFDRYEEVDGVLTARRWTRRWKTSVVTLHLNIRYNGAVPDTTLPEL